MPKNNPGSLAMSRTVLRILIKLNVLMGIFILALLIATLVAEDFVMKALMDAQEITVESAAHRRSDGRSAHEKMILVVAAQPVRASPAEDAAVVGSVAVLTACGGRDEEQGGAPAQVVARQADWARVTLATRVDKDTRDPFQLLVTWDSEPKGWVRLYEPGPVPGTRLRRWCTESWGPWP